MIAAMSTSDDLVMVSGLAAMLGEGWTRPLVWYWLHQAGIEVPRLANGNGYIRRSEVAEVLERVRAARAARRHDGQGGGEARARQRQRGGVY